MQSIDIRFCRTLLGQLKPDLEKLGVKIVKDASVLDCGFNNWYFETQLEHPKIKDGNTKYCLYVCANNAYEARYYGWDNYINLIKGYGY